MTGAAADILESVVFVLIFNGSLLCIALSIDGYLSKLFSFSSVVRSSVEEQ
jgi:hypothetical protein